MIAHNKSISLGMQAALGLLITFHKSNQVFIRNCSQHVRHLGRHLGFFKNFIWRKIAANFIEISRKHVFATSNRNLIKSRVLKKKLKQIFPKIYRFLFQTLVCIINYA